MSVLQRFFNTVPKEKQAEGHVSNICNQNTER